MPVSHMPRQMDEQYSVCPTHLPKIAEGAFPLWGCQGLEGRPCRRFGAHRETSNRVRKRNTLMAQLVLPPQIGELAFLSAQAVSRVAPKDSRTRVELWNLMIIRRPPNTWPSIDWNEHFHGFA